MLSINCMGKAVNTQVSISTDALCKFYTASTGASLSNGNDGCRRERLGSNLCSVPSMAAEPDS